MSVGLQAIRLSLVYVAAEKALPFGIKVPNAETRAGLAELDRREDRSFDGVAELLADLNAGTERHTGFAVFGMAGGCVVLTETASLILPHSDGIV